MDFGHLVAGPPSLKVAKGHSGHVFDRVMDTTSAHNEPFTLESSHLHLATDHIKGLNGGYLGLNAVMDKISPSKLHFGATGALPKPFGALNMENFSTHGTKMVTTTTPQTAQDSY